MGFTTAYRWEGYRRKPHNGRPGVEDSVDHNLRSLDPNHEVKERSNESIDAQRTENNIVMVNDGNGGFKECKSKDEWNGYREERLEQVKNHRTLKDGRRVPVAHRKDAIVTVETIMQLDPEFTKSINSSNPEEKAEAIKYLNVMIDKETQRVGQENAVGYVIHADEKNYHVHFHSIPVTKDGRLSYKAIYNAGSGPKTKARYKKWHDEMRDALRDAGYDATHRRVSLGKKHLGVQGYKDFMEEVDELRDGQTKLGKDRKRAEQWAERLDNDEYELNIQREEQSKAEAEIIYNRKYQVARDKEQNQREQDQDEREEDLRAIADKINQRQKEQDKREQELNDFAQQLTKYEKEQKEQREYLSDLVNRMEEATEAIPTKEDYEKKIEELNEAIKETEEYAQHEPPNIVKYMKQITYNNEGITAYDHYQQTLPERTYYRSLDPENFGYEPDKLSSAERKSLKREAMDSLKAKRPGMSVSGEIERARFSDKLKGEIEKGDWNLAQFEPSQKGKRSPQLETAVQKVKKSLSKESEGLSR